MSQSASTLPPGRRRQPRALLLASFIAVSALASYVVIGWFRPIHFPSMSQLAMDLNIAVGESNETVYLRRTVTEHRMVSTASSGNEPVYSLYTDESNNVIGFAGVVVHKRGMPVPPPAPPANDAVWTFVHRYFPGVQAPTFVPVSVRTPDTAPQLTAQNTRLTVGGFHIWIQDFGVYEPDERGAEQLTGTRHYWVITAPSWEIPLDVSAR